MTSRRKRPDLAAMLAPLIREMIAAELPVLEEDIQKRVLALLPSEDAKPETTLRVLLNVDSELRRRVPAYRK